MSKIKDLLAEEEGIDDLIPPKESVKNKLLSDMEHVIGDNSKDIVRELYEYAEFDYDEDELGHQSLIITNFDRMCDDIAEGYLEDYVYQQHVDISDDDYNWVLEQLKECVAESFDCYYNEIIKEAEERE